MILDTGSGPINFFDALKDEHIVEIAIKYCKFDDVQAFKLIKWLYDDTLSNAIMAITEIKNLDEIVINDIESKTIFPKNLMMLLIHLDKISLFEKLFQIEILNNVSGACLHFID